MRKKKLLIVIAVIAAIAVPLSAFAATSGTPVAKTIRSFFRFNTSELTGEQKAYADEFSQKVADLQKEFINRMVDEGVITREQGDAAIRQIEQALENSRQNGTIYGLIPGSGYIMMPEKGRGTGLMSFDTSKLTDEQKKDLLDTFRKMAALHKEYVVKMAANGLITQQQADFLNERIDKITQEPDADKLFNSIGMILSGFFNFGCVRGFGTDESSLTEQQKADLESYSSQMEALRKELIEKLVKYEVITQEQADKLSEIIENREKTLPEIRKFLPEIRKHLPEIRGNLLRQKDLREGLRNIPDKLPFGGKRTETRILDSDLSNAPSL